MYAPVFPFSFLENDGAVLFPAEWPSYLHKSGLA